jgi:hypothetical protein
MKLRLDAEMRKNMFEQEIQTTFPPGKKMVDT